MAYKFACVIFFCVILQPKIRYISRNKHDRYTKDTRYIMLFNP